MFTIRDVIILAAIGISLPLCFLRPMYGIIVWTVMAFVNPQTFGWGLAQQSSPALLVAIPTILGGLIYTRGWHRLANREVLLLLILWVWFTITTFNSGHDPMFVEKSVAAWDRWSMVSKILLMTVMAVAIVDSWQRLRLLLLTVAGCFGFLVVKDLPIMILTNGASRVYGPSYSMIADNNDFGLALNMALPFFFFLAKTERNRKVRWLMMFLFLATIAAIVFTYSRGALIGLIAVLGCMLLQARLKGILLPVVLLAFLAAAFLTPQAWRNRMSTDNALDASARSRLNVWQYSWALASDYPVMGGGFDAFTPSLFVRYAPDPRDVHGPHSVYFGVLAEHGFTGLAMYLTLVLSCLLGLGRIIRRARLYHDNVSVSYANMLRFSMAGFLASGAFLGRAYFDFFFLIVACVAILRYLFWMNPEVNAVEEENDEDALAARDVENFSIQARAQLTGFEGA
jgi:probable O-glycosylation ligase (exosortase A-associated)